MSKNTRIAIVDYDLCKPKKCNKECVIKCPSNQIGKECVVVEDIEDIGEKSVIYANLCIGCGLCVKYCPYEAITIVNIPKELSKDKILMSYGENSFRVYNKPYVRKNSSVGIIGSNGLGKSTILKILSGNIKINIDNKIKKKLLSGTEIFGYLKSIEKKEINVSYKPQDISIYNKGRKGNTKVSKILNNICPTKQKLMDLEKLADRTMNQLSGGETQRLLIALACSKKSESYIFDEPTAFLDIKQRIIAGGLIQDQVNNSYVVIVEHDLCIFDYICDYVVSLYGGKGAYGVVSSVSGTYAGINNYLEGYLPTENVRFREKPIKFKAINVNDDEKVQKTEYAYSHGIFRYGDSESFTLEIEEGSFSTSEVTLLIGENGTGKSTMINMLAGILKTENFNMPELSVSMKRQSVYINESITVKDYLLKKIGNNTVDKNFNNIVLLPLKIDKLFDLIVKNLSGGQMQKLAIVECLGINANMYLLDEPSAYVDGEDRMVISNVMKKFAFINKKALFLVEHDMIMATNTCERVIVFEGEPGIKCKALTPTTMKFGINRFLKKIDVTMRRDKKTGRPRINKRNGIRDKEQKKDNEYFVQI